jgi:5-methyltetrahydropteroyltriglutamate--homocysteine methyltransferase
MVSSSVLGFPRIGKKMLDLTHDVTNDQQGTNREVKKAVESYWAGKIDADALTQAAADVRKGNWQAVKGKGVDFVPR